MIPSAFEDSLRGLSKRARYLIGVSGGRDSVVLLRLLHEAKFSNLVVCHLDHQLRGNEATADARFVSTLATELRYPIVTESVKVAELAKSTQRSIETAAREARHTFFAQAGRAFRCHRLLLAHHADDQAETVLFQLLRGTGSALGMRSPTTQILGGWRFEVSRPFLRLWRREIDTLAHQRRWKFREDSSNAEPHYLRNRLRHHAIPMLNEVIGREVAPALCRLAEIASAEEEWMESLTPAVSAGPLSITVVASQPLGLQRRILHRWLRKSGVVDVGFREVEAMRELAEGNRTAVNLAKGRVARRKRGLLRIEP